MKTKSTIKLFATAILATAVIGASEAHADAKITRDTVNDSVEIVSDPYKTFEEADNALNTVKDKYLEEYGSYRAGINPTEDLKNYEVYAVVRKVSLDETSESTVQNVAKALSHSQSDEPVETPTVPATPETPSETTETPTVPATPTTPTDDEPVEIPAIPAVPSVPSVPNVPNVPSVPSVPNVPNVPSVPNVPNVPSVPSVPSVPNVPNVPNVPSVTPTTPAVTPAEQVATAAPSAQANSNDLVEDNSKPTIIKDQEVKPAQSIVAVSDSGKVDNKVSENEHSKINEDRKTETSAKSVESEPIKNGEDRLKELPNTGEASSSLSIVGLMILSVFAGFFGFKKRNS